METITYIELESSNDTFKIINISLRKCKKEEFWIDSKS